MINLVNFAIQYADKGFSVIPVVNKQPLIKFADRKPLTASEIKNFWLTHPYAGIALKTDKFFVVDVDRHTDGDDGTKSIRDLNHNEWFNTLCQKTAHGGYQFFFKKPKERITQNIGFLPGVDIKAHKNNYVVVAPTEIDGVRYQWLNRKPMAKPDEGLIKLIEEKAQPIKSDVNLANYEPSGKTQTSKLFEQIVTGLGETGGRNNALASFAGALLFRNVEPKIVLELARIANENTPNSLPDNEVIKTVNSMIKKEIRRRGESDER
ncbi:bifunctional DNA primase/polymerase [uncultured Limosilactobacillus sp.]|uniref:bifunctional DNA primase/polymerase n=1 Tax=uncultured Limosilactobacillus sp. TaxID=2837629 RepID=UPI00259ADFCE|nr:bifunctional DNA primase/polymerase [uncultured Limosilactobacillus sp.]